MNTTLALIDRMATRRGLAILFALYALVFGTILVTLGQLADVSGGRGILDFDVGYTPARVDEVLGSYGAAGMALYGRVQLLDLLNPALYGLIMACLARLSWGGAGPRGIALLPLLAPLMDYAENLTLALISGAYPQVPETLVRISSALSLVKNAALGLAVAVLLAGVVVWVMRRRRAGATGGN